MTNENMIQAVNAAREIFESLIVAQSPLTPFRSKDIKLDDARAEVIRLAYFLGVDLGGAEPAVAAHVGEVA